MSATAQASKSTTIQLKPIRCLVIQLARLGDTLQSLMALRAAKQLYPQLEIHFVAREKFAAAAKRVPWIDEVITLPTDELLGPILSGEKTEKESLGDVARWIAPLVQHSWDLILNWSYSEASSYLAGLLPGKIKLGYTRAPDLSHSCADGWSQFIQGAVQGNVPQNIHLTDILTTQLLTALQIHAGDPVNDGNSPVTSKTFFTLKLQRDELNAHFKDLSRKWIAIQLGAGQESKTWPVESWARLASMILRRNPDHSVVLLGGKEDVNRLERFMEEILVLQSGHTHKIDTRQIISLVGQTDFDLWTQVVSRAQWLLACDTAAIHLASVLGTHVLNVSVGPVRWSETGPYGNGHYVVASGLPCLGCAQSEGSHPHSCQADVTPEAVYTTWSYGSTEWAHQRHLPIESHFSQLGFSQHLTGVGVYRSRIRGTNDGGGIVYEPLIHRPMRIADWTAIVMGNIARAWYCGWIPPIGQEISRDAIGPILIRKLRELEESTTVLLKVCEEANRTVRLLNQKSSALRSDKVMDLRERNELIELGKKLSELDGLIERLGKTDECLRGFAQMSRVLMHNLRGTQLSDIGKESAQSYKQIHEGVVLLRQWVKFTLDLARPIGLATRPATGLHPTEVPS